MSEESLKTLSRNYKQNLDYFKEQLGVEPSYDVISHEMIVGGKQAVLFFIQGFV
ncbi:MAG: spore germination protein, partial [Clostridia bacterium]|nr:spore germination protein [Clostridia bacterium]